MEVNSKHSTDRKERFKCPWLDRYWELVDLKVGVTSTVCLTSGNGCKDFPAWLTMISADAARCFLPAAPAVHSGATGAAE